MTRLVSDLPRSWSYNFGLGLAALVLVFLVLVLYTFGLASNTVVHEKTLCDIIMLKCNKHLCFFRAINTATVPNVTGHHFFDILSPSYFLITTSFFPVMHSCFYLTGLGLIHLVLVLQLWSWS